MNSMPPALQVDILTAAAGMLALIALALLWRHHAREREVAGLRAALGRERQARGHAEQALAGARRQLAQQNDGEQAARERERRRIGRDLHDDLGQHLLALSMESAMLAKEHPALHQPLAQIAAHVKLAVNSLRSVVRNLLPEALECGLQGAVQQQIAQFSRLSGIPCTLDAEPAAFAMPPDTDMEATLYRIVQETLSNIARHAQASEVRVAMRRQPDSLNLTIHDNGVGLPHAPARRGCGLRGITQRVAESGGRLRIASAPGEGTTLMMSFPIGHPQDIALHQKDSALPAAQ